MSDATWWWMSFADPFKPKGTQFLGVVIVEAVDEADACTRCWEGGLNPGGEILCRPLPANLVPAPVYRNRLLAKRETERLVKSMNTKARKSGPKLERKRRIVWDKMTPMGEPRRELRGERYVAKSLDGGTGWRIFDCVAGRHLSDEEVLVIPDEKLRNEKVLDS